MFMEKLVFSEVLFASKVYQNISRIELTYVIKTSTLVLFGPTAGNVIPLPWGKESRG